jgi:septal ring factor EnvC (AmiA/AmiB activator)
MQSEVKDLKNLVETLESALEARDEHLNALSKEIEYLNMRLDISQAAARNLYQAHAATARK